ncbi:hypothetical protein KSS87_020370 [Heliosperma pusillum]|nr:hypothetical protein KSS87_020370 [Heliosperma pusillum]
MPQRRTSVGNTGAMISIITTRIRSVLELSSKLFFSYCKEEAGI